MVWNNPSTLDYHKLIQFQESELKTFDNSAQIFNALSDVPGDVQDVDELIEVGGSQICTLSFNMF